MPPQGRTLSESEFTGIRDKLIASAPDGLSESDFNIWLGPRLAAAIGEAENRAATPEGSAGYRLLSNFGAALNPVTIATGLYEAGRHPIETAKGISANMGEDWQKAKDAFSQGRYSEAAGYGITSQMPVIGRALSAAGEQIASGDVAGGVGSGFATVVPLLPTGRAAAAVGLRGAAKAVPTVVEHLPVARHVVGAARTINSLGPILKDALEVYAAKNRVAPAVATRAVEAATKAADDVMAAHLPPEFAATPEAEAAYNATAAARVTPRPNAVPEPAAGTAAMTDAQYQAMAAERGGGTMPTQPAAPAPIDVRDLGQRPPMSPEVSAERARIVAAERAWREKNLTPQGRAKTAEAAKAQAEAAAPANAQKIAQLAHQRAAKALDDATVAYRSRLISPEEYRAAQAAEEAALKRWQATSPSASRQPAMNAQKMAQLEHQRAAAALDNARVAYRSRLISPGEYRTAQLAEEAALKKWQSAQFAPVAEDPAAAVARKFGTPTDAEVLGAVKAKNQAFSYLKAVKAAKADVRATIADVTADPNIPADVKALILDGLERRLPNRGKPTRKR